jgi:hypothetical protein
MEEYSESIIGGKPRKSTKPKKPTRRSKGGSLLHDKLTDTATLTDKLGSIKEAVSKPGGYDTDDIDTIIKVLREALTLNLGSSAANAPTAAPPSPTSAPTPPSDVPPTVGGGKSKATKPKPKPKHK